MSEMRPARSSAPFTAPLPDAERPDGQGGDGEGRTLLPAGDYL
jgi:hypothetical protein